MATGTTGKGRKPRTVLKNGSKILRGRYTVERLIHSKGMSNVYMVTDTSLHKVWCLKEIIKSEAGKDLIEYQAILDEANIMKGLNHPNIPRIVTIEEEGDSIFIIMDYVEGMSLKEWLNDKGRIDIDVAVMWMQQIITLIAYLHNLGNPIFYRDMKPDNVMITKDGSIKLLDFGISVVLNEPHMKIERPLGTPGYAAPEQAKVGKEYDLRSDIYALGMTFYYMLTGVNVSAVHKACKEKRVKFKLEPIRDVNPKVPYGLEYIIEKCIQRNPDERYQSCEELLLDLQNYRDLGTDKKVRERRKLYAFLVFLLIGFSFIGFGYLKLRSNREKEYGEYLRLLEIAESNDRRSDWLAVLDEKGDSAEGYLGLLGTYKNDGVFDSDEESEILGRLNANAEKVKKASKFGEMSFELGKLYWFYTEDENYGMVSSARWFYEAKESGYDKSLSSAYYNVGSFKKNIGKASVEGTDSGMYKDYFEGLVTASNSGEGDLVTLQLNKEIAECLYLYMPYLKKDGVSGESVISEVESLVEYMNSYETVEGKQARMFAELYAYVAELPIKYASVYRAEGINVEGKVEGVGEEAEESTDDSKGGLHIPKFNLDDIDLSGIKEKIPDVDLGFGVDAGSKVIESSDLEEKDLSDLSDKVINGYEDGGAFGEDGDLYRSGSGLGEKVSGIINKVGDFFINLFDKISG